MPKRKSVCLSKVLRPTQKIFTHMKMSPLPVKGFKFDLRSAPMAIEQWGFHLMWHGASVYNGHRWRPMTLIPVAEHLAVELSLPVFMTWVCHDWDSNSHSSASKSNALTDCATAAVKVYWQMEKTERFSWNRYLEYKLGLTN